MKRALIAQLGERQTEDLKVTGSIPVQGISFLPNSPFFVVSMVIFLLDTIMGYGTTVALNTELSKSLQAELTKSLLYNQSVCVSFMAPQSLTGEVYLQ
jgi:hypothetical protein